jgi:DnaJ family protein C protein 2
VLGIESLRYKATQSQIKKAHKKKVLKYHPDKNKESGAKERDLFTCITKAFEFLSDPVKRKSYDSVDPTFDETIPSVSDSSKRNFYKAFGDAFERNARWSIKKNVPKLGDENSTFDEINEFYSFWYDMDSWREFSYLDEESKESAQDRDERRWIDKTNKAARAKLKKEETARLRQLVDNAYACDPRIIKFKQEEKKKKEDEKLKRKEAIRLREEELLRVSGGFWLLEPFLKTIFNDRITFSSKRNKKKLDWKKKSTKKRRDSE